MKQEKAFAPQQSPSAICRMTSPRGSTNRSMSTISLLRGKLGSSTPVMKEGAAACVTTSLAAAAAASAKALSTRETAAAEGGDANRYALADPSSMNRVCSVKAWSCTSKICPALQTVKLDSRQTLSTLFKENWRTKIVCWREEDGYGNHL